MVILGLGTNHGGRKQYLQDAAEQISPLLKNMQCSPVYESPALLPEDAPKEWNMPFLNMAVCGETTLTPHALLAALKAIEERLGRISRGRWGPREIDIDILAFGEDIVTEPSLVIPHSELLKRDFALIPLADLAPHWLHPAAQGKTARELAAHMRSTLVKTDIRIL
jgi:2-amino-4-hydroxy-6-hydroxymethyldihydropteridine diphosphokinase